MKRLSSWYTFSLLNLTILHLVHSHIHAQENFLEFCNICFTHVLSWSIISEFFFQFQFYKKLFLLQDLTDLVSRNSTNLPNSFYFKSIYPYIVELSANICCYLTNSCARPSAATFILRSDEVSRANICGTRVVSRAVNYPAFRAAAMRLRSLKPDRGHYAAYARLARRNYEAVTRAVSSTAAAHCRRRRRIRVRVSGGDSDFHLA